MSDRARQFLPFDALKGFKEAIKERQKIKVDKIELSEEMASELSYKLSQVKKGMIIKVIHYDSEEYIEKLLNKLLDMGAITQEEFDAKKKELLGL